MQWCISTKATQKMSKSHSIEYTVLQLTMAVKLTLYDSLGCSKRPFAHFSKGLDVISKLQEAINTVWPGADYAIQWSDLACLKVSEFIWFCNYLPWLHFP